MNRSSGAAALRALVLAAFGLIAGVAVVASTAADGGAEEYQVKAAFLINFLKFVQLRAVDGPIVIAVVGQSPIDLPLIAAIKNHRAVGGRTVQIHRAGPNDELSAFDLVFISATEGRRTPEILAHLRGTAVLTVGETAPFLREGGVIHFFVEQNRVRFHINTEAAAQAGLKISSQLLSLAAHP